MVSRSRTLYLFGAKNLAGASDRIRIAGFDRAACARDFEVESPHGKKRNGDGMLKQTWAQTGIADFVIAGALTLSFAAQCFAQQAAPPPAQLTLKRTVELAVANSRDIAQAKLSATLAQKNAEVDRSAFRPNLSTGSGAAYTSGFPLAPGLGVPAIFELSYNQALFNPQDRGQIHADEERATAQSANADAVRNTVIVRAASDYLELAKVRRSLELLRKGRDAAAKITTEMQQRVAAGYELPIEETRAELAAAQIEQQIAQSENRAAALEDQLRDMLGLAQDQPIELVDDNLPATTERPVAELVADAISSDAGLKQAEAEQRAREDVLSGARRSRWPTLSLVGTYSVLSKANNYTEFFNKFERNNVVAGVQIQVPIFAAHTNAAISTAEADVNVAALDVKSKRSQLAMDVRAQARAVREAELGKEVARLDLKLAQQNQSVVQAQFDQGRATLKQLSQAQLDENDKWLAFLDADFQRQQAELRLLQLTGQVGPVLTASK
jgi:outer membrane protein